LRHSEEENESCMKEKNKKERRKERKKERKKERERERERVRERTKEKETYLKERDAFRVKENIKTDRGLER
jgi:hypothetical protein